VSGQTVQESLDVRSEDGMKSRVVNLIQMFSKTIPEVKGDTEVIKTHHNDTELIRKLRDEVRSYTYANLISVRRSSFDCISLLHSFSHSNGIGQYYKDYRWTTETRVHSRFFRLMSNTFFYV